MGISDRRFFGGGGSGGGSGGGIPTSDKGTPDGVATLGDDGKLTAAQLPATVVTSSALGAASGVATLDSTSKIPAGQLPALAIVDYLGGSTGTANQAAMLALTGQQGDWTIRVDTGTVWVIIGATPSQLSSWQQLQYPSAPVTSVAGRTGTVVVSKTDVGLGSVDNTADTAKPVSTAQSTAIAASATTINNAMASALANKADLVSGLIPSNQLPAIAITDVYPVVSQAAMLALTAQRGDIAIRSDTGKTYVLATDTPATLADWKEMPSVGAITSVNGATGVVVLGKTSVGLGSVDNTADTDKPVSTAVATALSARLAAASNLSDLADPAAALTHLGAVGTGDSRLSDARTPTAHAGTHTAGGSDAIVVAQTQVTGLVAALAVAGSVTSTAVKTADYAAVAGQLIPVDATAGAVTISLPAATAAGLPIVVRKIDTSGNAVTVARTGSDVIGVADTSYVLALKDQAVTVVSAGGGVYHVASDAKTLASLDARFQEDLGVYSLTDPAFYNAATHGTDLYPAFIAISALLPAYGAKLVFPRGVWTFSQPAPLKTGMHIEGAGKQATRLIGTTGVFWLTATTHDVSIEHIRLDSGNGHIIGPNPGSSATSCPPFYQSQVRHCHLETTSTTASIMYHHTTNVTSDSSRANDYDAVIFEDIDAVRVTGSTVPGWDIVNGGGGANENIWRNIRVTSNTVKADPNNSAQSAAGFETAAFYTTSPAIWLESNSLQSNYAYDNEITNIIGENNPGGLIVALSCRALRIHAVVDWDTPQTLYTVRMQYLTHLVYLGKSAVSGAQATRNVEVRNVAHRGGNITDAGGVVVSYPVYCQAGAVQYVDIYSPHNSGSTGKVWFSASDTVNCWNATDPVSGTGGGWPSQPNGVYNYVTGLYVNGKLMQGATTRYAGTGTPERVLAGNPGDVYARSDGGPTTSLYVKGQGTTSQGWVPVTGTYYKATDFLIHGDGVFDQYDDTAAINALFALLSPGDVVFFPAPRAGSYYKISGALTPPAGVTILGGGSSCEIRQTVGYTPVFDLHNVAGVTISGFFLNVANPCGSTGGSTFRGDNLYMYSAGVWANTGGNTVTNCKIRNFACGVNLTATSADDATFNDGVLRVGNVVRDCELTGGNFGVKFESQQALQLRGLYIHNHTDSSAGVYVNHGIWASGSSAAPSVDVIASDIQDVGNATGSAYAFGYVSGLVATDLLADTTVGLFTGVDLADAVLANMVGRNDQTTGSAKWAFTLNKVTTQPTRITMTNIAIQMGTDGLAMIVIADQVTADNIALTVNHSGSNTGSYDLNLRGASIQFSNVRLHNIGSVQYKAILVGAGSTYPTSDVTVRNVEVTNAANICDWNTAITGRNLIDYDPGAQRTIGTSGNQLDDQSGNASWGLSRREWVNTYAMTASATITPLPACETTTRISSNDTTAFTIAAPLIKPKPGMTHEVVVYNGSGTTMGAITWNGAWVLRSTWTNPPAGESHHIRFVYDTSSTTWREISRSVGAGVSAPTVAVTGITGATAAGRLVGATASGAPASGTFLLGDYAIDQTGKVWICTTAGSPGTWVSVGGAVDVQIFTGNGTWTRPTWATGSSTAITSWRLIAAGGSGGAGAVEPSGTAAVGGGGGGSGAVVEGEALTANLGSPLSLLVGTGGAAVAGRTAGSVGAGTNGNAGGQTNFSSYGTATGGAGGVGGGAATGGTGGTGGTGNLGASASGGAASTSGAVGGTGGSGTMGAGGGAGGGITTAGTTAANGGAGGKALTVNSGPAAATGGVAGGAAPGAGWSAPTTAPQVAVPGNGGGGGAASITAAVDAQTGGAAGSYGAGSGGGGAALSTVAGASGGSQAGANGIAIITTRA